MITKKQKICKRCNEVIAAAEITSNVQKYHKSCAEVQKKERDQESHKKPQRKYARKVNKVHDRLLKNKASFGSNGTKALIEKLLKKREDIDAAIRVLQEMSG